MIEVLLNVQPFMQPTPKRNPGGDCFACALTAAVRYLYPDNPVDFNRAWDGFIVESSDGTPMLSNTWSTMWCAACSLHPDYPMEVRHDLVMPTWEIERHGNCWWRPRIMPEWAYRLEAWLSAGWVALTEVSLEPHGPLLPDGRENMNDHFVVLDGQRHFWKDIAHFPGAKSLAHETHVVCSAKGAYWIDTDQLLHKHGAAGLYLLRKDRRK